jgi:ribokinase
MLLVAGSLAIDRVYRCAELPEGGGPAAGSCQACVGGSGGVTALAARRSGAAAAVAAAVGDDVDGKVLRVLLARSGVEAYLSATKGVPTGNSATFIEDSGRHLRVDASAANALFEMTPELSRVLEKTQLLLCDCSTNSRALAKLMGKARELGVGTILDVAPPRPEVVKILAPLANLVVTGVDGFSELVRLFHPSGLGDFTGEQIHALSDAKLDALCRATLECDVVVMMGLRGAFVSEKAGGFRLVGDPKRSIDTSVCRARETFVGALAARLADGDALRSAVRYALVASSMMAPAGGQDAIPAREAVLKEMNGDRREAQ